MKNKKYITLLIASLAVMAVLSACAPAAMTDIKDITWKWTNLNGSETVVSNPEQYTITFGTDGNYNLRNDCNVGNGAYTMSGSSLTIQPGASTLAYCGDASLDQLFISSLASVESFKIENGKLMLTLAGNAGVMQFSK